MMSLAWPLFRVTEQAALAAWPQIGCGDKNKIDGLAVTAMRQALNDVAFRAMRWQSWPSPHEAACYTLPICI